MLNILLCCIQSALKKKKKKVFPSKMLRNTGRKSYNYREIETDSSLWGQDSNTLLLQRSRKGKQFA